MTLVHYGALALVAQRTYTLAHLSRRRNLRQRVEEYLKGTEHLLSARLVSPSRQECTLTLELLNQLRFFVKRLPPPCPRPHSSAVSVMALTSPSVSKTVHFVGSICLPDTPTVFQELCLSLLPHLRRIPDGETGKRGGFIQFQKDIFADYPFLLRETISAPAEEAGLSEAQKSIEINLKPLEYDQFAISSYKEFCKLRDGGAIPQHVRFQVCLPTPINIVCNLVHPAWRAKVEPIYEKAMLGVLRRIQDSIPAKDLSIQLDAPSEFAYLEGVATVPVDWFSPVKEGLIERMVKLASAIDDGVELGFHFCYGDFGHKHFTEPKDVGLMVEVGTALLHAVPRPINWIHMPVPKDRTDAAYFSPLKELELGTTELYLGLLYMNDEQGTRERKEEAKKIVSEFGISTECGMGRATEDELNSVLQIAKKILN